MAEKGFPLSYKKIKEYALSILCTKDPTHATIGENWAQQFGACFEDWTGVKACGIMEKKHASALNPATVSNYFELLKTTLTHHNILPKNIYNCDETGCPLSDGQVWFQTAELNHKPQNQTPQNQTTLNHCLGSVLGSPPQDFYPNQFELV